MVYWSGPHVCFYICFYSTVNKPLIYPSTAFPRIALFQSNLKIFLNIPQIPQFIYSYNQQMGRFEVLASFTHFPFFSSGGDYTGLESGETVENNHNPSSEGSGLAWINIDGNLACFLCLKCFREFYCSPGSLLRQYLWVGRPVYAMNKEQQWTAAEGLQQRGASRDSSVCVFRRGSE